MQTPVLDDRPASPDARRRRGWLAPVVAVAAGRPRRRHRLVAAHGPDPARAAGGGRPGPGDAFRVVLTPRADRRGRLRRREVRHRATSAASKGDASLEIDWYPASGYDSRYDRPAPTSPTRPPTAPPSTCWASGQHVGLLRRRPHGDPGRSRTGTWRRAAARPRSSTSPRLATCAWSTPTGSEAALPNDYVTDAERDSRIDAMLDGIDRGRAAAPAGMDRLDHLRPVRRPHHLGADVTGQIARLGRPVRRGRRMVVTRRRAGGRRDGDASTGRCRSR